MQDYDSKLFTEEQIERALEENNIRAYFLEVDFKDLSREYNTGFQFAKGEVNSGFICFKLLYGESGIILKRGCTVYANIRKTTGETFKSNLSVLDYQNGIVLLSLSSQVLSIVGVDRLELAVIIDEEKTISPKIKYKVYESFDGDDKTDAENHPPLLDSEDLRLLITELRKEVEVNKVNIEDLTEKTGSNLKLIQSNTTKINSNTSEIEKIKQYNTNNDSKISNIENSIEENTNNISTNTNKIGELENKANTNESNISSNASKIELIEGEIETLKQYDSSNDTKISEIESKVDTNKSGIANNSSKIEQAISKIEENKTNISGNSSKISVLENKIPTIESKISGHTSKIEVIEGKIPTVESGILNNASKIDKLEKKIPTIETNISGNSSNITKIEAKVESLETSVSGNSSSIEEVKGEVATIKSSISSNTSEVSKLKEKLSGMEPNVTSVVSKVEEIERQIPAIESRISGNTSNISTVKTKVEKNTSDITKISKRLDGLVVNPNVDLEEIVQARTATTGEKFDTLDERIDCEVDRLNKKIDVTMLQQEDKGSHTIENTVDGMTTDMVVKGRTLQNLWDIETTDGFYMADLDNGYYVENSKNFACLPNTKYTVIYNEKNQTDNYASVLYKDVNGIHINEGANCRNGQMVTFTTPSNCYYLYTRGFRNTKPHTVTNNGFNFIIIKGELKESVNYFEGIKSFGQQEDKISILSSGKNLINFNEIFSKLSYVSVNRSDKTITATNEAYNDVQFYVYLRKGKTYKFSYKGSIGNTGSIMLGKQKGYVAETKIQDIYNINDSFVFNHDNGIYTFHIVNVRGTVSSIQLEEGKQSTSYEPYKCDKKDILLQNLGFDEGLRGFDLTICDELNDIKNVAIKRIEKHIFNATEVWQKTSVGVGTDVETIRFQTVLNQAKDSNKFIANFPTLNVSTWDTDKENMQVSKGVFYVRIKKNKLETQDVNGFVKWLKGNPLELYYELAEPVETPLNESIALKVYDEKTHILFENAINGTSSFKAPVNTVATIARLNRENRALEEENKNLKQDFKSTTLTLIDSDLELVKQNVDMDFRLMEVEFALDIPQAILSSNINFKNKKGEVKSMARTPYEMMKIVILSGDYDREDYIHKVRKYYERGRMTKEEHDELMSLMTADEVISKKN
ncbi:hypothetical protein QTH49_13155 [Clostridium perfringens]|nr:hypothetical protein [Clostridium perfringens]